MAEGTVTVEAVMTAMTTVAMKAVRVVRVVRVVRMLAKSGAAPTSATRSCVLLQPASRGRMDGEGAADTDLPTKSVAMVEALHMRVWVWVWA